MSKRAKSHPYPSASIGQIASDEDAQRWLDTFLGPAEGGEIGQAAPSPYRGLKRERKGSVTKRIAEYQSRARFDQPQDNIAEVFAGGPMGWMDALHEGWALSRMFVGAGGVSVQVHDADDDDRIAFAWRDGVDDAAVAVVPGVELRRQQALTDLAKRGSGGWREEKRVKRGGWRKGRQRRARVRKS